MQLYTMRKAARPFEVPKPSSNLPHVHVGVEVEVEWRANISASSISVARETVEASGLWATHSDGSVRSGLEYVFARPLIGQEVEDALRVLCTALGPIGASNIRNSTHIHVNMSESADTDKTLFAYISLFMLIEQALFQRVGAWRAATGFCDAISGARYAELETLLCSKQNEKEISQTLRAGMERYYSLNLASLAKYGTVEVRLFPASYELETLMEWVRLVTELKISARHIEDNLSATIRRLAAGGTSAAAYNLEQVLGSYIFQRLSPFFDYSQVILLAQRLEAFDRTRPSAEADITIELEGKATTELLTPRAYRALKAEALPPRFRKFLKARGVTK